MPATLDDILDRLERLERRAGISAPRGDLRPYEHEPAVPLVENLEVVSAVKSDGVTSVVLRWTVPQDPNIETFEVWAKNATSQASAFYKLGESNESPAAFTLEADVTTVVTFAVRTRLRGNVGSALTASPTVTADIEKILLNADSIADGAVQDQHLDRVTANKIQVVEADITNGAITNAKIGSAAVGTANIQNAAITNALIDNLAVTNAKVNDLAAGKITAGSLVAGVILTSQINATQVNAGTLAAGVILSSNILATQISAGTMSAVNVSAGTFSLTVGANQMLINGTVGFQQVDSSATLGVRIVSGTLTAYNTSDEDERGRLNSTELNHNGPDAFPRTIIGQDASGRGHVVIYPGGTTTPDAELKTDGTNGQLLIDGDRVVTARKTGPAAVSGTAGATYTSTEQTLINDLKAAVNTLRDALRVTGGHGLTTDS